MAAEVNHPSMMRIGDRRRSWQELAQDQETGNKRQLQSVYNQTEHNLASVSVFRRISDLSVKLRPALDSEQLTALVWTLSTL